MSDSVRPHRRQPTRLPCPQDSSGKNTGVGCHFLLQCMKVKSESEVTQSCPTLSDPVDCSPPGSTVHGIFQARGLEWGAIAFSAGCVYICLNAQTDRGPGETHQQGLNGLGCSQRVHTSYVECHLIFIRIINSCICVIKCNVLKTMV